MKKQKKPENPRVIIEKLRYNRYSYRDIATALKYRVSFIVDHSLLCRIYNAERQCNQDLAIALNQLWELEK